MINAWLDAVAKLLALKNLDKLPKWVVVSGVAVSAIYLLRGGRIDAPARDIDAGVPDDRDA